MVIRFGKAWIDNYCSDDPNLRFCYPGSSLHPKVVDALTKVRLDWEAATDGRSLLYQESSVGLVLFDIVTKLNVPIDEQRFLLGAALFDEITAFVTKQG